ncbi:MAG: polysaccharide deacetylase family protein [Candidatus Zixiibacteriota bacterium]|nr:MAG: polysaccharide deacetylase family protein [candidate division Zixibacteria bacterium]
MRAVPNANRILVATAIAILLCCPAENALGQGQPQKKNQKQICITFDELPAAKSFDDVDREAVTYLILQALRKHEVKAAGFVFVNQIEGSFDILGQWLNEGHILGNMTFSNQDLHELGIEQFILDIRAGWDALETMLEGFGQKRRYFRYPFLHYGNEAEAKKQVKLYLDENDYVVVHATVITEDYLYNLSLEKMGKVPDSAKYDNLLNEYVNHVLDEIVRMEMVAAEVLKRPCRHILRLKANRLNAVFLDEMLGAIKDMGYQFITLEQALDDELYIAPEAYFGSRGLSYIEMLQYSDPDHLPAE